ncbi:N(G),N(G)-dimethylarginine dimethylaminohydrolase [Kribbella sandramycini]|uniref:Dimethylargininase n=1 Tax=Kribbella sandramycini TaxID=60450 RepID=A0A7Y4NYA8_9ACTN|nr:dimethylargininase [Kribbella sandramycini]MBB6569390.1 dimethylargininase [Kribbella sandramycini]NOL40772.1 N(G),N(G)-dimethylarginine dimethylaminohydrolase [Kribbella sandramycini]
MPSALVRRPSPRLAEGLVTHIERTPVDLDLAVRQWQAYVDVLEQHGWTPVEVPPADDCPDGVFIEDALVVYGDLAVIVRAGAESRRPEAAAAEETARAQGYRITHITAPGTLDGGDVLKVGTTVYVGLGGRTNEEGIRQFRAALEPLGADVRAVPVRKVLHLKSAVTALPDGTVIGYEPLVDDPAAFDKFRAVPEEGGSHVVLLGDDRLLMAASAPQSAELFRQLGYTPVVVDISEFEKLEGCVTCLSVRLRR